MEQYFSGSLATPVRSKQATNAKPNDDIVDSLASVPDDSGVNAPHNFTTFGPVSAKVRTSLREPSLCRVRSEQAPEVTLQEFNVIS